MSNLHKIAAGGLVALAMGFAGMASVQAGGYASHKRCFYKLVITYEIRIETVVVEVTELDELGRPITVQKEIQKAVKVPVKKLVKVCR